jgi:hypothetical protein
MHSFTLIFTNEANCNAFCTWCARFLGGAQLERTNDSRCVHVPCRRQFLRTIMTVAL